MSDPAWFVEPGGGWLGGGGASGVTAAMRVVAAVAVAAAGPDRGGSIGLVSVVMSVVVRRSDAGAVVSPWR